MAKAKKETTELKVLNTQTITDVSKEKFGQTPAKVQINGVDYSFLVDSTFRNTKINALLEDLNKYFAMGMNRIELLDLASPYVSILIIKHFSSLEVPEDIDELFLFMKDLIDTELLAPIINEFPEQEIVKLFEKVYLAVAQMEQVMEEASKISDEQLAELEKSESYQKALELEAQKKEEAEEQKQEKEQTEDVEKDEEGSAES